MFSYVSYFVVLYIVTVLKAGNLENYYNVFTNFTSLQSEHNLIKDMHEVQMIALSEILSMLKITFEQQNRTSTLMSVLVRSRLAATRIWSTYDKIKYLCGIASFTHLVDGYNVTELDIAQEESLGSINNSFSSEDNVNNSNLTSEEFGNAIETDKNFFKIFHGIDLSRFIENVIQSSEAAQEIQVTRRSLKKHHHSVRKIWQPRAVHTHIDRRLLKGHRVSIQSFPFVGSVHVAGVFTCSAVLVARRTLLSAASCLHQYNDQPDKVFVRVGSDYAMWSGEKIPVSKIQVHPDFDPSTLRNNLVLLKLSKLPDKKIEPIGYRQNDSLDLDHDYVTILGWGAQDKESVLKINWGPLSGAILDVLQRQECQRIYSERYVTLDNFCGVSVAGSGSGACNGDVGSPGLVGDTLAGLVTFGAPVCGIADAPTVLTSLEAHADWIESSLNSTRPTQNKIELKDLPSAHLIPQQYYN